MARFVLLLPCGDNGQPHDGRQPGHRAAKRRVAALAAATMVAGSLAALSAAAPASAVGECTATGAPGTTVTCTYSFTGDDQVFDVPPGVKSVTISAVGAHGGDTKDHGIGGYGAAVADAMTPIPDGVSQLFVEVGDRGENYPPAVTGSARKGGYNGGGSTTTQYGPGAGGGGASSVQTRPNDSCTKSGQADDCRLVVAGGGGGGGGGNGGNAAGTGGAASSQYSGQGGPGGDLGIGGGGGAAARGLHSAEVSYGGAGTTEGGGAGGGAAIDPDGGPYGGTGGAASPLTAGGGGGGSYEGYGGGGGGATGGGAPTALDRDNNAATAGAPGLGGSTTGGGAGGGGFYGGGAGYRGGGGAGSSYAPAGTHVTSDTSGTAQVTIRYTVPNPALAVSFSASLPPATVGVQYNEYPFLSTPSGGSGSYSYTAVGLTNGLSMDSSGRIVGYPSAAVSDQPVTITVTDANDSSVAPVSSSGLHLTVAKASPTLTLGVDPTTSTIGQTVTLTAALNGAYLPDGADPGDVTFMNGTTPIGDPVKPDGTGKATLTTATLPLGTNNLTARYSGNTNNLGTTQAVGQTVSPAAPTLAVTAGPNPAVAGLPVTLTATLNNAYKPTGTVTFREAGSPLTGAGNPATVTAGPSGTYTATFTTATLTTGTHHLTATYNGDTNNTATNPMAFDLVVNPMTCATAPTTGTNVINGTTGNNTINGTKGDDIIFGKGGNDTINGNGGNDLICTTDGNDIINTAAGNDRIEAGNGNNIINTAAGDDTITTGTGNDIINAGTGHNTINPGTGHNTTTGG